MSDLPQSEQEHLTAAQGWLELGNLNEAMEELDRIAPVLRARPDVMDLRCKVYLEAKRWNEALTIAETLVTAAPQRLAGWLYRSGALHGLNRTEEAFQQLCRALGTELYRHWEVKYALAQYACHQRQFRAAYALLKGAFDVTESPNVQLKALNDPMLEPLWKRISEL